MAEMVWKESFNTGIGEIDRQHRLFLDYLNQCSEVALSRAKEEVIPELVGKMKEYSQEHFKFEEALLKSVGMGDDDRHLAQHAYFNARVAELEEAMLEGVNEKAVSMAAFMRDWMINHILEEDKRYAPLLAQKLA